MDCLAIGGRNEGRTLKWAQVRYAASPKLTLASAEVMLFLPAGAMLFLPAGDCGTEGRQQMRAFGTSYSTGCRLRARLAGAGGFTWGADPDGAGISKCRWSNRKGFQMCGRR